MRNAQVVVSLAECKNILHCPLRECKHFFPSLVLLHCIRCVAFLKGNTPIKSQCVAALCSRIYLHHHRSVLLQTSCPVQTVAFHLQALTDASTHIKMFTCEGRKGAIKGSHGLLMSYEMQEPHDPFRVSMKPLLELQTIQTTPTIKTWLQFLCPFVRIRPNN